MVASPARVDRDRTPRFQPPSPMFRTGDPGRKRIRSRRSAGRLGRRGDDLGALAVLELVEGAEGPDDDLLAGLQTREDLDPALVAQADIHGAGAGDVALEDEHDLDVAELGLRGLLARRLP